MIREENILPATPGTDPGCHVLQAEPGVLESTHMGGHLAIWCCVLSVIAEFLCHVWLQVIHNGAALGGWTSIVSIATFPHLIAISRLLSSRALSMMSPLLAPLLVSFAGLYTAECCVPAIKGAGGDVILNVTSGFYVGCTIPIVVASLAGPLVRMTREAAGHRQKSLSGQPAIGTDRDADQPRGV